MTATNKAFDAALDAVHDMIWDGDIGEMMVAAAQEAGLIKSDEATTDAECDAICAAQSVIMKRVLLALADKY